MGYIPVNVVRGGRDAVTVSLYGAPNRDMLDHIEEHRQGLIRTLGTEDNRFVRRVNEVHERHYGRDRLRSLRTLSNEINDTVHDIHIVRYSKKTRDYRGVTMRYAMANPRIYTSYIDGELDGYGDIYEDNDERENVRDRHDYKMARSGMVEDDGMYREYISTEKPLDDDDKFTISKIWKLMEDKLDDGDDPTYLDRKEQR